VRIAVPSLLVIAGAVGVQCVSLDCTVSEPPQGAPPLDPGSGPCFSEPCSAAAMAACGVPCCVNDSPPCCVPDLSCPPSFPGPDFDGPVSSPCPAGVELASDAGGSATGLYCESCAALTGVANAVPSESGWCPPTYCGVWLTNVPTSAVCCLPGASIDGAAPDTRPCTMPVNRSGQWVCGDGCLAVDSSVTPNAPSCCATNVQPVIHIAFDASTFDGDAGASFDSSSDGPPESAE
jgi:hypothetical protein